MKKLWQSLTQIYWPEIRQHFGFDTFKKAWQNIIRNPIISFSGILIISVMLIFLHISFALNFMAKGSLQVINQKIDLIAEVKIGNDQTSLEPLIQEIRKVPDLIDVKFIDENTALRNFLTRHPGIKVFMDRYQIENPLPPTLEITTKKAQSQKRIFEILTSATYQDLIQTSSITSDLEQESRWQKIISFSTIIEKFAIWFV
ncbi:MAG TPA: permease-like cell division protein FtsX, partial [Candidatus Gracilibacteria bacterium]|nr:permease-like cell division protein FtsX [Candidatus Gracilibacteria bacterium]